MERTSKFCNIVLASASPRRAELLGAVTEDLKIIPANVDEDRFKSLPPKALVQQTSRAKFDAVATSPDCTEKTVISADTVVYRKKLYGKPSDLQNAVDFLTELCGKWHRVFTGVTVCFFCGTEKEKIITFSVCSYVKLKALSLREIEDYVYTMKPLDKAGAYAIQENTMVEKHIGSYSNIVGLPMERLTKLLLKHGR